MLKITWDAKELLVDLRRLKVSLEDHAAVHRIMGEVLLRNTQRRFRREVSPDGKRWPALSPVTLAARRNKRGILRDTGELFGSIHMQADNRQAEVGHQHGATIRPKRARALRIPGVGGKGGDLFIRKAVIPPRPYLGIGAEDAADVLEAVEGWLEQRITKSR